MFGVTNFRTPEFCLQTKLDISNYQRNLIEISMTFRENNERKFDEIRLHYVYTVLNVQAVVSSLSIERVHLQTSEETIEL